MFSVELGLKALILEAGGTPRGHNVEKLFGEIKKDQQASLIKKSGRSENEFYKELGAIADAFIEWRYLYEQTAAMQMNSGFLSDLARALVETK